MPLEKHPTKPDTLVFRRHPATLRLDEMKSASIEGARAAAKRVRDRNTRTWDEVDREVVFAIDALVAHTEWLLAKVRSTSNTSQES